jgi:hypothetical protein
MVVSNNADISISSLKAMSLAWASDDEDTENHFGNQFVYGIVTCRFKGPVTKVVSKSQTTPYLAKFYPLDGKA